MEFVSFLPLPPILFTIGTILVVSGLIFSCFVKNPKKNVPPGPKGWPIVGYLFQMKRPTYKTLQTLSQEYGPVMCLKLGSVNTIIISSSQKAKEFFKSSVDLDFASRPRNAFGKLVFYEGQSIFRAPYGKIWRETRKLCVLELLTSKRVASFAKLRKEEVDIMVQQLWNDSNEGSSPVNISEALSNLTSNVVWRIICGKKFAANHEISDGFTFKSLIEEINFLGVQFCLGDFIPFLDWMDIQGLRDRMKHIHTVFDHFANDVIEERLKYNNLRHQEEDTSPEKDEKVADFLDILLLKGSDIIETKSFLFDMSSAATETTSTTMEWAMALLLKHPETLRKAREEIDDVVGKDKRVAEKHVEKLKYMQCVLKESMRLYPAVPLAIPHCSMKDTKMFGYDVPKGTTLLINVWAIARDGAVWEDPDEFKPERFINDESIDLGGLVDMQSIPFSAGRRGCPGMAMATSIILFALATLIHTFEWSVDRQIDMTEAVGITSPKKFPLIACPYKLRQSMT